MNLTRLHNELIQTDIQTLLYSMGRRRKWSPPCMFSFYRITLLHLNMNRYMTYYVHLISKYVHNHVYSVSTDSDAIQTTNQVGYVWTGPWTLGNYLFLLNRYLPFFDTFIFISCPYFASTCFCCHTDLASFQ